MATKPVVRGEVVYNFADGTSSSYYGYLRGGVYMARYEVDSENYRDLCPWVLRSALTRGRFSKVAEMLFIPKGGDAIELYKDCDILMKGLLAQFALIDWRGVAFVRRAT